MERNTDLSEKLTKVNSDLVTLQHQYILLQKSSQLSVNDVQNLFAEERNKNVIIEEELIHKTKVILIHNNFKYLFHVTFN